MSPIRLPSAVKLGRELCGELSAAERREWLVTNGIGGFASGTLAGSLTRRYHGLLVAALQPPVRRTMLVATFEETADYGGASYALSTSRWGSGTVAPAGYRNLERFRLVGSTPEWTYALADAALEKRLWMVQGENVTIVEYRLARSSGPLSLEIRALVNYRDFHAITRANGWSMQVQNIERGVRVLAYGGAVPFTLTAQRGEAQAAHEWFRDFALPREAERGLEDREDHLHAVTFQLTLGTAGDRTAIVLSAGETVPEQERRGWLARAGRDRALLEAAHGACGTDRAVPVWIEQLVLAADQFIVQRSVAGRGAAASIVAGYHWFSDWGRDTMIALPGIALATGRPQIAAEVLRTFAEFVDGGMVPNVFPDAASAPEYNTVDAALWYIEAVRRYEALVGDVALADELYPVLTSIVAAYSRGTRYGIRVDASDGLLRAGVPGVQLTWMDAKVGERVITPRCGKAVEVNALWYNALRAMQAFAARRGDAQAAQTYGTAADRVQRSFERFWLEERGYCADVIDGPDGDDAALRPNQLFAVALHASPLSPERRSAVVSIVGRRLLTSHGLRSLDPADPAYHGRYGGSVAERDGAYHQGTVWCWLIGPWIDAYLRVGGTREEARAFLQPMAQLVHGYGLGTLPEIADGDAPFRPNGCIAQAWTVGEVLRAWHRLYVER